MTDRSSLTHRRAYRCMMLATLMAFMSLRLAAADRPNVIFLMTDDQRQDTLGCYGNQIIQTPHIDRLAARGVTFDRAFVTSAICVTNRACVLSGQYAARHGMWDFDKDLAPDQLAHIYPAVMKSAGYRTGFIGKWGVGDPPDGVFDYNQGFPGQGKFYHTVDGAFRHLTAIMGDQAEEFLQTSATDQPFCLSISFKAPHVQDTNSVGTRPWLNDPAFDALYADITIPSPKLAASRYFDRLPDFLKNSEARRRWAVRFWGPARYQESVKGYYRLITGVDAVVGRIVHKLDALGQAANTVILFTSDHGYYLGERGFAGKWYPHETSIRIPLVVYDPRLAAADRGTRRDDMVLSIDFAPTMLDMAGVPIPARMQGRSFVPLLAGDVPDDWRKEFYYEHMFVAPWAGVFIPRNEGVRTRRWKYIRYIDSHPLFEEVYDLDHDPLEEHNLAASAEHAETLASLRRKWLDLRERVR